MENIENYFNAPIFESAKALYVCRYQNKLEFELMKRLEEAPKVRSFYQPLLTALVRNPDEEKFIHVDFWIEYHSGKIDLLFIETDFVIFDQARIIVLSNSQKLLNSRKVGFAVLNPQKSQYRKIASANLQLSKSANIKDFCFVNFSWIN